MHNFASSLVSVPVARLEAILLVFAILVAALLLIRMRVIRIRREHVAHQNDLINLVENCGQTISQRLRQRLARQAMTVLAKSARRRFRLFPTLSAICLGALGIAAAFGLNWLGIVSNSLALAIFFPAWFVFLLALIFATAQYRD